MRTQTFFMLCYRTIYEIITCPRLPLSDDEVKTLEAAEKIIANQYLHTAVSEVMAGDGNNIAEFLDEKVLVRMETYNAAAKRSMDRNETCEIFKR